MSANAYRGEVALSLGGQEYVLRPSFAALAETESALGDGILNIARRFSDGTLPLSGHVALVAAGMRAAGGAVPENLGEKLLEAGLLEIQPILARFIMAACGIPLPEKT